VVRRIGGWYAYVAVLGLAAAGATSCVSPPARQSYPLYPGPARPLAEIAVLRLGDARVARIDGLTAAQGDWTEVHLLPGRHRIEWTDRHAEDGSTQASLEGREAIRRMVVDLEAGHTYSLRSRHDQAVIDETTARPAPALPWTEP
jgi:hypothetical protein